MCGSVDVNSNDLFVLPVNYRYTRQIGPRQLFSEFCALHWYSSTRGRKLSPGDPSRTRKHALAKALRVVAASHLHIAHHAMPNSLALSAACVRSETPSLPRILVM